MIPTNKQAVALYEDVTRSLNKDSYSLKENEPEYEAVAEEMREILAAKSDRAAGATILWWDCWDKKFTATKFAQAIRQRWAEQQKETVDGA